MSAEHGAGRRARVLLVEDDPSLRWAMQRALSAHGYEVRAASCGAEAAGEDAAEAPVCVLVDVQLPDTDGIELLRRLRDRWPEAFFAVVTSRDDTPTLARALEAGANDYLVKPVDLGVLMRLVEQTEERHRHSAELGKVLRRSSRPLLGTHPSMERARRDLLLVAGRRQTCVLVHGETGTGKDVVAHALHELDGAGGPLVDVNCAAVPESLFESELFGHEAGAFTGARAAKVGILELAERGTLFLDEIGDLPPALQPKLLRAVEERTLRRVGGTQARAFDARLVSATHLPVTEGVGGGRLRADLFFRLAAHVIHLPPLRERGEDVLVLADYFLARLAARSSQAPRRLSPQAARLLMTHAWPGNVRELKSAIERAALLATDDVVRAAHLPASIVRSTLRQEASPPAPELAPPSNAPALALLPVRPWRDVERDYLGHAFEHFGRNLVATARALGLSRTTLRGRLRRMGVIATDGES